MKKLITLILIVALGLFSTDFTPKKSKKCKDNAKKVKALRKSGHLKM
jgi:hypothetical protein